MKNFTIKSCFFIICFLSTNFLLAQSKAILPQVEFIKINGDEVDHNGQKTVYLNNLNETFKVKLQGKNAGGTTCPVGMSFLSISFEQFNTLADKDKITYYEVPTDLDMEMYFGEEAQGGDGDADYVMVEGTDNNGWTSLESNYYELNVKPKAWGAFVIHFKLVMAADENWNDWAADPTSGPPDPIGEPSYVITVNVKQTPGTIKVYVKDQDNNYREDAIVQRFDANWNYISSKTTNSSGYVSWNDFAADENYHFKAYWDTPVLNDYELWDLETGVSVSAGGSETITLKRVMPYTIEYDIENSSGQQTGYSGDIVPLIPGILCHRKQM
jgi:hypothetical protein